MKRESYLIKIYYETLRDLTSLGGWIFYFLVAFFAIIYLKFVLFLELVISFFVTLALSVLIRTFYFKKRPIPEKYIDYLGKLDASSFPSLHSMRTASLAVILFDFFVNVYVRIFILIAIFVVAYSRIALKKHYFTDVFIGVILGLLIGLAVIYIF